MTAILASVSGCADEPPAITAQVSSLKGEVQLSWNITNRLSYADGFQVVRGPTQQGPWTKVATLPSDAALWIDSGNIEAGTYYQVVALSSGNEVFRSAAHQAASTLDLPRTQVMTEPPPVLTDVALVRFQGSPMSRYQLYLNGIKDQTAESGEMPLAMLSHGEHQLMVRAEDAVGNLDPRPPLMNFAVYVPRFEAKVSVKDSEGYTNATEVVLALDAKDAVEVALAESADGLPQTPFRPYYSEVPFKLSPGDGPKTIYARFRAADGEISPIVSTRVILDTEPPMLNVIEPGVGFYSLAAHGLVNGDVEDSSPSKVLVNGVEAPIIPGNFFSISSMPIKAGTNFFEVTVRDAAGNETTRVASVTVGNICSH